MAFELRKEFLKTKKSSRHGEESNHDGMVGRGMAVSELGALVHTAAAHTESLWGVDENLPVLIMLAQIPGLCAISQ